VGAGGALAGGLLAFAIGFFVMRPKLLRRSKSNGGPVYKGAGGVELGEDLSGEQSVTAC